MSFLKSIVDNTLQASLNIAGNTAHAGKTIASNTVGAGKKIVENTADAGNNLLLATLKKFAVPLGIALAVLLIALFIYTRLV